MTYLYMSWQQSTISNIFFHFPIILFKMIQLLNISVVATFYSNLFTNFENMFRKESLFIVNREPTKTNSKSKLMVLFNAISLWYVCRKNGLMDVVFFNLQPRKDEYISFVQNCGLKHSIKQEIKAKMSNRIDIKENCSNLLLTLFG